MAQVKNTTPSTKVEEVKVEEVKAKKVGIGSTIIELILANPTKTNQEILDEVKAKFEKAQTTYACIAWYKSKLRKEGKIGQRVFTKKVKVEEAKAEA
jgi:hypothetical protein